MSIRGPLSLRERVRVRGARPGVVRTERLYPSPHPGPLPEGEGDYSAILTGLRHEVEERGEGAIVAAGKDQQEGQRREGVAQRRRADGMPNPPARSAAEDRPTGRAMAAAMRSRAGGLRTTRPPSDAIAASSAGLSDFRRTGHRPKVGRGLSPFDAFCRPPVEGLLRRPRPRQAARRGDAGPGEGKSLPAAPAGPARRARGKFRRRPRCRCRNGLPRGGLPRPNGRRRDREELRQATVAVSLHKYSAIGSHVL